jgi:glycine dehydrogenase subunit 1
MDYVSNQSPQIEEMLATIGIKSIDELLESIPLSLRLTSPLEDDGLSEFEGKQLLESLAAQNTFPSMENYLGGGAYDSLYALSSRGLSRDVTSYL